VKAAPAPSAAKYIPPAQRALMAAAAGKSPGYEQCARQIRGLMNRMGEANVAGIVNDEAELAQKFPRLEVCDAATKEIIIALTGGPERAISTQPPSPVSSRASRDPSDPRRVRALPLRFALN